MFTSQVDFVFFGISAQSCLKTSDNNSEFEKYNSSDDDSDFEGFTQANICKAAYATRARPITSFVIGIDTIHEEHSHNLDNSKSDVSIDEVSYIFCLYST